MMNHDLTVSGSVIINAGPEKVWKALTDPEIIKEYLFGTETLTDWNPGSEIIFQGEYNGHKYRDKGIILENRSLELLSYSYWSGFSGLEDTPGNYSTIIYKLKVKDAGQTEFTWIQTGYANEEGHRHSQEGMSSFLDQIKEIVER